MQTRKSRVGDLLTFETNVNRMNVYCQRIFDHFVDSLDQMPWNLNILFFVIRTMANVIESNLGLTAAFKFFFLRLVCPMIIFARKNRLIGLFLSLNQPVR